ncbi:MAG: hypothetical protein IPL06_05755 [Betaproteobacteria bacterium]|nr:hypothetical protein [Betaproteobacteria bacterium]
MTSHSERRGIFAPLAFAGPLAIAALLVLAGCAGIQPSVPLPRDPAPPSLAIVEGLPAKLPERAAPFPKGRFVLLPAMGAVETVAELASPVPLLVGAVADAVNAQGASAEERVLVDVDPQAILAKALADSSLLTASPTGRALRLRPFVFIQECVDDRYRLTYVADLEGESWSGRYLVHLPGTFTPEEYGRPTPATLARLRDDLVPAAARLRDLMERDARGELPASGSKVDLGSYHLVGSRSSGLLPPELVVARGAEVIVEDGDRIVTRIAGDPGKPVVEGGLFFGVHEFRRSQLHTIRPAAGR